MRNPYWRLHFRPWLEEQAARQGTDYRALWNAFRLEGERRWRQGQWVESFDWPDIARELGLEPLPDPVRPSAHEVRALILPGAESALRRLHAADVRLGVVTNGFLRFQKPYLDALGWEYGFKVVVTPDLVGAAKPAARVMAHVSPGLAHIGDRLSHDILVAQRTDRVGILIGEGRLETDRIDPLGPARIIPDIHLHHLGDLPNIVTWLLNRDQQASSPRDGLRPRSPVSLPHQRPIGDV